MKFDEDTCPLGDNGLTDRLHGTKFSSKTLTKFDGNTPTILLSRCNLPVHHDPSPALRHSIKSPSINPKSRFVSPPQEYTALHQHGNFEGNCGASGAIANAHKFELEGEREIEKLQGKPSLHSMNERLVTGKINVTWKDSYELNDIVDTQGYLSVNDRQLLETSDKEGNRKN